MDKSARLDYRGAVAVDTKKEGITVRYRDKKQKEEILMKRLYSILIATLMLLIFVPAAAMAAGASGFPTWSSKFTKGRFTVLPAFNKEAVFDKETGLVWELSPDTGTFTWYTALAHCYVLEVGGPGGRKGWRLPTIEELASLVDTSVAGSPKLPAGHPFSSNVQSSSFYWSATTLADDKDQARQVSFGDGNLNSDDKTTPSLDFAWCVRGGQGIDGIQ